MESDDSYATGRRDRVGTKAEKELTKLFEGWLNSTTAVLRAAIFGDDAASWFSCFVYRPSRCDPLIDAGGTVVLLCMILTT